MSSNNPIGPGDMVRLKTIQSWTAKVVRVDGLKVLVNLTLIPLGGGLWRRCHMPVWVDLSYLELL